MKKWIFLLRAFFPSWRFFEDVGPELSLEVRAGATEGQLGEWRAALPPIGRSFNNVILNPQGGFLHAAHNLLNHFASDIQDYENIGKRPAYALVKNLARQSVQGRYFQFRLLAEGSGEVLLSPVYQA